MRYKIIDKKYHFASAFDDETCAYIRTGILDENGRDTGVDPFMDMFPHLIDVGVMGHCIHGKTGLCARAGVGCYQSGALVERPNMTVEISAGSRSSTGAGAISWLLGAGETRTSTSSLRRFCRSAGKTNWFPTSPPPATA